jgi:hypothetical protein
MATFVVVVLGEALVPPVPLRLCQEVVEGVMHCPNSIPEHPMDFGNS